MENAASSVIDIVPFTKAEDLLAALRPASPLWGPNPWRWVFRGHADASWQLLPSVNGQAS
jgi:hypothetical protein